jgi:BON domain
MSGENPTSPKETNHVFVESALLSRFRFLGLRRCYRLRHASTMPIGWRVCGRCPDIGAHPGAFGSDARVGAPGSIRVETVDRVVYLNGQVSGGLAKHLAETVATEEPGVRRVVASIEIAK